MKSSYSKCVSIALFAALAYAQTPQPSLKGAITDPSGAVVPGAMIQIRGPKGEQRVRSGVNGEYAFPAIAAGKYQVRVIAKGFSVNERADFDIAAPTNYDVQLSIKGDTQVLNVEEEANRVSTDVSANGTAIVLRERELAALSDDPDELAQQLQAMAGPSGGPNGGQIYIDGFTGGNLPPKSAIREVRINSNPYSPEYERPGFGRIEILTRPGSDKIRGQAFLQYNKEALNSRSPLLTQSKRPPYQQKFFGLNLSGPIKEGKASFGFDFERRNITENSFVLATTLDANLNPQTINQAVVTPQTRTNFSPRLDLALNSKNTLIMRYQFTDLSFDKEGVGNFALPSRAYGQKENENTFQLTETAVLSASAINETRFQFLRTNQTHTADNSLPAISVQGAFDGGNPQIGNSGTINRRWELSNNSTLSKQRHTIKWGVRLRQVLLDDTSVNNFGGTYTFFGGTGPALDANNQPIAGSSIDLTALERYRRTLYYQKLGYTAAQIRALGGGASQFSLSAGTALQAVNQFDMGMFINDDFRVRQNLTLSYGLRYEAQTNIGDKKDFSPRIGVAWGIDSKGGSQAKTVLRAGFGIFYDRVSESTTLSASRFNGISQQSYLLQNPDTYPAVPSLASLSAAKQSQQLQLIDSGIVAPRNFQASVGVDRQINKYFRFSTQYIASRGVHLQRSVNINAPLNGVYPFADRTLRYDTQSTGFSRGNQIVFSPNLNYKKLFLFGFYGLGYGKSDSEGQAANPYNLRAEWGPSSFSDVRHRAVVGTSLPMPWKISLSPFIMFSSGSPYNITTGRDTNLDGITADRPALTSIGAASCKGGDLVYSADFGCFNLNPAAGTPTIGRNIGRGPSNFNMSLRMSRTWAFGNKGESGPADGGMPPGMGGARGGGPPPGGGGPGGGGPPPGGGGPGGGGPPAGMFGGNSGKKYNLILSVSARNAINHANYAAPSGDLSSPYFGQSRSLAGFGPFGGASTYNRKVDVQLRLTF